MGKFMLSCSVALSFEAKNFMGWQGVFFFCGNSTGFEASDGGTAGLCVISLDVYFGLSTEKDSGWGMAEVV